MKIEGRFDEHNEDSTFTTPSENTADSSISGDEAAEETYAPSPKKSSRRGGNKRVVTVPIADGCRSKSEVYPPPDSWSWRKYGQKPIKGSPYPRGYYKCSSSKGCPARKQVERSRLDPTTLLITYSCNHNHPLPTKNHHHHHPPPSSPSKSTITSETVASPPPCHPDNGFIELDGDFGWLCSVGPTIMDGTTLVGPTWGSQAVDMEFSVAIREEDKFLFGDLGDLPESSMVFRQYRVEALRCGGAG